MAWAEKATRNGQQVYRGRYRDAEGRVHTAAVDRLKRVALRAAQHQETHSREAAQHRVTGPITLQEYYAIHWFPHRRTEINTRAGYESHFRTALAPAFGDTPLREITSTAIQAWVTTMTEQHVSPVTIHARVGALQTILAARRGASAIRDGYIDTNPVHGVQLPRMPRREVTVFTPGEVDQLLDAIGEPWRLLCEFVAGTGLRWGEAIGLEVGDFEPDMRRFTVRRTIVETTRTRSGNGTRFVVKPYPKNGHRRRVGIAEDLSTAVQAVISARALPPAARLFTMPTGATPSRNYFRTAVWLPALDRAGMAHRRFHDLRGSHISWLLAGGADLPAVMARVGHHQFETTRRYTTVMDGADDRALDALTAVRRRHDPDAASASG